LLFPHKNESSQNEEIDKKLDDSIVHITSAHTFIKEAKNLLDDHHTNKTELDIDKLHYMIVFAKSLLDVPHFECVKKLNISK